jgi:hypothetical protein
MKILHSAIQYESEEKAEMFFGKVLCFKLEKEFVILSAFSADIFGVKSDIKVRIYSDGETIFEIFIVPTRNTNIFDHICLEVKSKEKLADSCRKYGIEMISTVRNGKTYLFIKDFSGYLYEIKEKK